MTTQSSSSSFYSEMTTQLPLSPLSSESYTITTQSSSQLSSSSFSSEITTQLPYSSLSPSTTASAFANYVISFRRHLISIEQHQIVIFQTILNLLHSRTSNNFMEEKDYTYTLVTCFIFSLGGKSLQTKDKSIQNNYHQIIVNDDKPPLTLKQFCDLRGYKLNDFYTEVNRLKRYYNTALMFALENNYIPINPFFDYTNLWNLLKTEGDIKVYELLYNIIILKKKNILNSYETKYNINVEALSVKENENITKDAIHDLDQNLQIIEGPFFDIENFDAKVTSYFEKQMEIFTNTNTISIRDVYEEKYLNIQEAWEKSNFKIVGNKVLMKNLNTVVREGASLLYTGKDFIIKNNNDNISCFQNLMNTEKNSENHSWLINEYGILKSSGNFIMIVFKSKYIIFICIIFI